jgi:hypothetical protein
MFEILAIDVSVALQPRDATYAKTFENSVLGDMTKLSPVLVHDIKCWIL